MRIHLGGSWHSIDGFNPEVKPTWTPEERRTASFVRDWIRGEQRFTFQTSGSTGPPKTVAFLRDQLEASATLTARALNLRAGTTALLCLDPAFIAGRMMIVRSLVVDMDLIVVSPSSNPLKALKTPIDFVALVPLQLTSVLNENPAALDEISTIIIGGAPLSPSIAAQILEMQCKVYATYGMTETLTHVALQRLNGENPQDAFHLLPGITATSDASGCLVINAAHLGQVITRDIVEWVTPASFRVIGRADDVINTGGVKVHPQQIEASVAAAMKELRLTARFFIAGQPDERLGERVCLVIEGAPLPETTAALLRSMLEERLSVFDRPREFVYRGSFQETSTRKVDRRATLRLE